MNKPRLKSRRRQDQGSKLARIIISVLATVGLIDTGSITLHRWGWIGSLSCPGGGEGCDMVLNSPWGTIWASNSWEIPLSLIGFISYLTIICLSIIPFSNILNSKKIDFSRNAWLGLFLISNSMTVFSFLLMGIMILKIQEFCLFCVLSALISSLIFLITIIGGGWEEKRDLVFRGIIISIIVLLGGLIWSSSVDPNKVNLTSNNEGLAPIIKSQSSDSSIALAKHLRKKNITLYNAYWCPHCHDQKEMFGQEASTHLILVECAKDGKNSQTELCQSKGITGFPSWEINGEISSGVKSLEELADITKYSGPRDF